MQAYSEYVRKAAVLVEALPYMQDFRGATVVVKFGGSAMEDLETTQSVLRDIVFMEAIGMKPVIVHGGGKEISKRLKELNIPTQFVHGLRYTCNRTIAVVNEVLHQQTNARLVAKINEWGGRARTLSGLDILSAEKLTRVPDCDEEVDLGFVGEVTAVDVARIQAILDNMEVPVITPLGRGEDGQPYNINADTSACRIAEGLRARKLVFLSDVPGILRDPKDESTLISSIPMDQVQGLIDSGIVSGGMIPKIHSAIAALRAGTRKVHMIDARVPHSLLLEIFTDQGIGTEIVH